MGLSSSLRRVSSRIIGRFGGAVTIRTITPGVYNPETGTVSRVTSDATVQGVLQDVNASEVSDLVRATDKRLLVAAADLTAAPTTSDRVIIAGSEHEVIAVQTVEQENSAILYDLVLRT